VTEKELAAASTNGNGNGAPPEEPVQGETEAPAAEQPTGQPVADAPVEEPASEAPPQDEPELTVPDAIEAPTAEKEEETA
jgi:hypothetical protein